MNSLNKNKKLQRKKTFSKPSVVSHTKYLADKFCDQGTSTPNFLYDASFFNYFIL